MAKNSLIICVIIMGSLASCREPVTCDYRGYIIIPDKASMQDDIRWREENRVLMNRRIEAIANDGSVATFYPRASLEKAASCP